MIGLVRHGKVRLTQQRWWWASEIRDLMTCYDHSPIDPPEPKIDKLTDNTQIICSSLSRSTDSALVLFERFDESTPLFREAELPDLPAIPLIGSATMVLAFARSVWCLGRSKGCESFKDFKTRCDLAANTLIQRHNQTDAPVILVGHAFTNHYVAKTLRRNGWSGPQRPSPRHGVLSEYHRAE